MIKLLLYGVVLSASYLVQFFLLSNFIIRTELISSITIFLSIIFGFYITSFTIFSTSRFVSDLYKIQDEKNKKQTLLHALMRNYKIGLVIILISILYSLIVQLVINQTISNSLELSNIVLQPMIALIILNFIYSFQMLNDLIKIIIQEAKNLD